jgi:hypothetical protein
MTEDKLTNRLELHYYFSDEDNTHSMDAVVRNKCEHELLQIVSTISKELNIQIKTETEAFDEGGLREFYTFIATAEGQIIMAVANLAVAALGVLLSRIPLRKSKSDQLEQKLSIEEKLLNIEAQKLNIELIKKELEAKNIQTTNINVEKIEYITINNIKILKHKSNFYKALINYPKVKRLSTVRLDENKKPIDEPNFIERDDFNKFILDSDNLEPIIDDSAIIEIISPVLKKGKYKWRGVYDKLAQAIEFSMTDKEFKEDIIEDGISFKSGTFIDCILEISRKIDDLGNIFNSNYSVKTVLRQHDEGISIETPQGKRYRKKKDDDNSQMKLFENYYDNNSDDNS